MTTIRLGVDIEDSSLSATTRKMKTLGDETQKTGRTIRGTSNQTRQAANSNEQYARSADRAEREQRQFRRELDRTNKLFASVQATVGRIGVALAAFVGVREFIQLGADALEAADAVTQLEQQFERLGISGEQALNRLTAASNRLGVSREAIGQVATGLALTREQSGLTADEVFRASENLIALGRVTGVTQVGLQNALVQFNQSLSSGFLRLEEYNSIAEQFPALIQELAKELGVGVGELRALAAEGKITSDVLGQIAVNLDVDTSGLDELTDVAFTRLSNEWDRLLATMGRSLSESAKGWAETIADVVGGAADSLEELEIVARIDPTGITGGVGLPSRGQSLLEQRLLEAQRILRETQAEAQRLEEAIERVENRPRVRGGRNRAIENLNQQLQETQSFAAQVLQIVNALITATGEAEDAARQAADDALRDATGGGPDAAREAARTAATVSTVVTTSTTTTTAGGGRRELRFWKERAELTQSVAEAELELQRIQSGAVVDLNQYRQVQDLLNLAKEEGIQLTEQQIAAIREEVALRGDILDQIQEIEDLRDAYEELGDTISSEVVDAAGELGAALGAAVATGEDLGDALRTAAADVGREALEQLGDAVTDLLIQLVEAQIEAKTLGEIFAGIGTGGGSSGGGIGNLIASLFNFDPFGSFGIPALANGGITAANSPTLAVVGDAPEPEVITPLSRLPQVAAAAGATPQTNVIINTEAGLEATAETDANGDTVVSVVRATLDELDRRVERGGNTTSRAFESAFGLRRTGN
ncbi:tape measure domain-containing protein [Shimia isoporae]|uniref:Tape measure domain-containing protein n=1 Tax=Shimia isoporae TaxID=647720 RepID=A0A4R1N2D3_9RHOB|nr:tape measure protein [Shimia isoporae]TCK99369.1 tape measure domain-containing protein [Shimia isoporae]